MVYGSNKAQYVQIFVWQVTAWGEGVVISLSVFQSSDLMLIRLLRKCETWCYMAVIQCMLWPLTSCSITLMHPALLYIWAGVTHLLHHSCERSMDVVSIWLPSNVSIMEVTDNTKERCLQYATMINNAPHATSVRCPLAPLHMISSRILGESKDAELGVAHSSDLKPCRCAHCSASFNSEHVLLWLFSVQPMRWQSYRT